MINKAVPTGTLPNKKPGNKVDGISGTTGSLANTIIDSDTSRLVEKKNIYLANIEFLKSLSQKYPFLTLPNSGIDPYSSGYNEDELNAFERRRGKDFQTTVGENFVYLIGVIDELESKGFDVSADRATIEMWKATYPGANYDLTRTVPEYGSLCRRGGIRKTIFGMLEIGLQTVGDDRLSDRNNDKYERARKGSLLNNGRERKFSQIQRFLSLYYNRPVELRWVHSIDPGNGHNLLSYGFRFQDAISPA